MSIIVTKEIRRIRLPVVPESCDLHGKSELVLTGLTSGVGRLEFKKGRFHSIADDPCRIVRSSPTDNVFATSLVAGDRSEIWIFDYASNKVINRLAGHEQEIGSLIYDPEGNLMSIDANGVFFNWGKYPHTRIVAKRNFQSDLRANIALTKAGAVAVILDSEISILARGKDIVKKFRQERWALDSAAYTKATDQLLVLNNASTNRTLITIDGRSLRVTEQPLRQTGLTHLFSFGEGIIATASNGMLYASTATSSQFTRLFNCGLEPLDIAKDEVNRIIHVVGGNDDLGILISLQL